MWLWALWTLTAAAPAGATAPPALLPSFQIGTSSGNFLVSGSTTDTLTPTLSLAVDGSTQSPAGPGLRHGVGQLYPVGVVSTIGMWYLDTSTFSLVVGATITQNAQGDPGLDMELYCRNAGGDLGDSCQPSFTSPNDLIFGSSQVILTNQLTDPYNHNNNPGGAFWNGAFVRSGSSSLPNLEAGSFTLELWAQFNTNTEGFPLEAAVGMSSDGKTDGYWIGVDTDPAPGMNGRWTAFVATSGGNVRLIDPKPQNGAWTHLALVFNSGHYAALFVDGRLASSTTVSGSMHFAASPPEFMIGSVGSNTSPVFPFKGGVDNVLYENTSVTSLQSQQDQIVADFISGTARFSTDSGQTWTYILDPSTVSTTGTDFDGKIDTVSITGDLRFVDCSTTNLVAFLFESVAGELTSPPVFQVPVATEPAPVPIGVSTVTALPANVALSSSTIDIQWDPAPTANGGSLCTQSYQVILATAASPTTSYVVVSTTIVAANRTGPTTLGKTLAGPTYVPSFSNLTANMPVKITIHSSNETLLGGSTTYSLYTLANPPSGTHMIFTSSASAQIAWNANGNPSYTKYILSYGPIGASVPPSQASTQTVTTVGITTVTLTGMATNQAYFFYTQAVDGNGYLTAQDPAVDVDTITMQPFLGNMFDHLQSAHLSGWLQTRQFSIDIPKQTFPSDYYLIVNDSFTTGPCGLTGSQPVSSAPGVGFPAFQFLVMPPMEPTKPVTVHLTYAVNQNTQVNELAALGGNPANVQLQRYDTGAGKCIPAVTQASLTGITAELNHMTVWQVNQSTPSGTTTLSAARVYPNPLYVNRAAQGYFIFDQMPAGTTIHIYDLRGERVFEGSANALGEMKWDAVNSAGTQVGSGIYLAVLFNGSDKRILKVGLER